MLYLLIPFHFCLDFFNFLVCFKNCVLHKKVNVKKLVLLMYLVDIHLFF